MQQTASSDRLLKPIALTRPIRLVKPDPWVTHIPFAYWLVASMRPRTIVELGTHTGNSYSALVHAAQVVGLEPACFAVDTWSGDQHAGAYDELIFTEWREFHDRHLLPISHLLRCTFDEAVGRFADGSIDLLHIDGLHTYEAVRHDFETWRPRLSERAVVLFHDTNVYQREFGVHRFWDEIRREYPSFEFLHGHGLGVVAVGPQQAPDLEWLTHLSGDDETEPVRQFFAGVGEVHRLRLHLDIAENMLADRDKRIEDLSATLSEKEATIDALVGSTSWRVTRPIRIVSHQRKRVAGQLRRSHEYIQRTGGLGETARRAWGLYRREGISGIARGLRIVRAAGRMAPVANSGGHDRNDYTEWVRRFDTLTDSQRQAMRAAIETWASKPAISIVMPTYNADPEWLSQAIDSVRAQIYGHWQLCIADDASTDTRTREVLQRYAALDPRIHVTLRTENGHIAAASNTALADATGDWIVLLDHDDVLAEHALYCLVDEIHRNPDAQLIYSDEDKLDEEGRRCDPYFKSDWNLDLFYSHNLFCHLGAYRADVVRAVGGFRVGTEGAQDHDLVLRCLDVVPAARIHHIPRVLYHWRIHRASTSESSEAKPYAQIAGEHALAEHFERRGVKAAVTSTVCGYRVRYELPDDPPLVTLVMPTRNGLSVLRRCVESILSETSYPNYGLTIVDNGSDDPATLEYLARLEGRLRVRIVRDQRPFNYSAINNAAVRSADGELVALVNNDLEVIAPDWLTEMVSIALQPGVGAVGAKLLYPNNAVQHAGVIVGLGGVAGHSHKNLYRTSFGYCCRAVLTQSLSAVTAACLVIRKSIYEEVGGLNETDLTVAFNDVDFCLRVRDAGYRNVWTPFAQLYHHESATRGYENTPEKQARFIREVTYMKERWGERLLADPAYSPNLTLDYEDFSLAWPPRVAPLP